MSLDETKENIEWSKRAFGHKQKNGYGIKKKNDTMHIHDKEVNKIA